MLAHTMLYPTRIKRSPEASTDGRRASRTVRAISAWLSRIAESCTRWTFVMEPWHIETLDMPEFRRRPCAAERSAALAQLKSAAHPIQQTYCAMIFNEEGAAERTFTFEDAPTLLHDPLDAAAKALLGHLLAADQPSDPLSYQMVEARRHGDMLLVKGQLPAGRGKRDLFVVAFAA